MDTFAAAAKRGLEQAGFVDVVTHAFKTDDEQLRISGSGMCPCGTESRFGMVWSGASMHRNTTDVIKIVELQMQRAGIKHIAKDREEGRWHD